MNITDYFPKLIITGRLMYKSRVYVANVKVCDQKSNIKCFISHSNDGTAIFPVLPTYVNLYSYTQHKAAI